MNGNEMDFENKTCFFVFLVLKFKQWKCKIKNK